MRFVFFGDGLWAANSLELLLEEGHDALAVILRKDQSDSTLERFAQMHSITCRRPDRVNETKFVEYIRALAPDLNISVSYDQILRKEIRQSAPKGFINVHAGKLPLYRGRNPINWAIINNETEIGLTVHFVDNGIDTGDIIAQQALPLAWEDDYQSVLERVHTALPMLVSEGVNLIDTGKVDPTPQAHLEGSYFSRRIPGDEWIEWDDSSLNIYNKIRAITHPAPGARTSLSGRTITIWKASYDPSWPKYKSTTGEVVGVVAGKGIKVKTADSTILIEIIQIENEPESTPDFPIGTRFLPNLSEQIRYLTQEVHLLHEIIREKEKND